MKLIQRNYLIENQKIFVRKLNYPNKKYWHFYIGQNNQLYKTFQQHFKSNDVYFKTKKEALYNLKNFYTTYSLGSLKLTHQYSVYEHKNCKIMYWIQEKDWTIEDYYKISDFNNSFKTRKEAIKFIDETLDKNKTLKVKIVIKENNDL